MRQNFEKDFWHIDLEDFEKNGPLVNYIKPSFQILRLPTKEDLKLIEVAGRVCYKSENKISEDSFVEFLSKILNRGHESVIEHSMLTVKFICDRGISHELVRHRLASFSQESTRYVKYNNKIQFILPAGIDSWTSDQQDIWFDSVSKAAHTYVDLVNSGMSAQMARSVLPNCLKTEVVVTANLREWRHILKLRTAKAAHPQMRELMIPLLELLKKEIPVIFDDI